MNERKLGKNRKLLEFTGITDFVEYCQAVPGDNKSKIDDNDAWRGGTFDDAVEQAMRGNPELVNNIFNGVNVINAMIEQEKVGEIRDVTGEYFDVADYLSGEPEVFRRDEYVDRKPVVQVYANFSMHSDISVETIINRGCAIIALCDELCSSGFIVDLHLVHAVRPAFLDHFKEKYYTNIKVGIDPLDLDTAAFIIANPLCLRRLWFAMLERATNCSNCKCYGSPIEYDLSEIFDTGLSGFYFVSSTHNLYHDFNYSSLESAKSHIMKMIEKFKSKAEQVVLG